jgi:hypothetical protein
MAQYTVVGIFRTYGDAERTVQDLERAGIVGEEVEMITDVDEDARTENTPGESSTKPPESYQSKLRRLFGPRPKPDVRDESGEMPNYIGEQEFYVNHVKEGGAVLVIRSSTEPVANRAATILQEHGARAPGEKSGPTVRRIDH